MKRAAAAFLAWPKWHYNALPPRAFRWQGSSPRVNQSNPSRQTERVEVPKSMLGRGDTFALRVKGTSMRDEGILPGATGRNTVQREKIMEVSAEREACALLHMLEQLRQLLSDFVAVPNSRARSLFDVMPCR